MDGPVMPQRPRKHVLETEARRAFRALVEPLTWVVRDFDSPDYGIDDTVEVFEGNAATGIHFYVQNRGTDETNLSKALTVSLKDSQRNYFASLNLPVLIVRYHAPTGATYVKWFHRDDPHPSLERKSVRLAETDLLTAQSAHKLATEARLFHAWTEARIGSPISMRVEEVSSNHDAHQMSIELATQLTDTGLRLRRGHIASTDATNTDTPHIAVSVTADHIFVDTGLATFTSHSVDGNTDQLSEREVASIIVFGAAVALDGNGLQQQAADLIEVAMINRLFHLNDTERAGRILAASGRFDCALHVSEHWLHAAVDCRQLNTVITLLSTVCGCSEHRKAAERRATAILLEQIGRHAIALTGGEPASTAAFAFAQAGKQFFGVGDWAAADAAFTHALGLDAALVSCLNAHADIAGAAHQAGDYTRAAALYTEMIGAQPENHRLLALKGDSLFHQGRLDAAADCFDNFLTHDLHPEPIWLIKRAVLSYLETIKIGSRVGDPAAAAAQLAERKTSESLSQTAQRCMAAVALDPTNPAAWSEIGQKRFTAGDWPNAMMPLVLAAAIKREPHAWALAQICAHRANQSGLAKDIAVVALWGHGEKFHAAVGDATGTAQDSQELIKAVLAVDAEVGYQRRPFS